MQSWQIDLPSQERDAIFPSRISMDFRKYYEILELTPGVSPEDAAQAYKDLVNVWHPDRFTQIPRLRKKAEKKLQEVNEAYKNSNLTSQNWSR